MGATRAHVRIDDGRFPAMWIQSPRLRMYGPWYVPNEMNIYIYILYILIYIYIYVYIILYIYICMGYWKWLMPVRSGWVEGLLTPSSIMDVLYGFVEKQVMQGPVLSHQFYTWMGNVWWSPDFCWLNRHFSTKNCYMFGYLPISTRCCPKADFCGFAYSNDLDFNICLYHKANS